MIHPNVIIYQQRAAGLKKGDALNVKSIPIEVKDTQASSGSRLNQYKSSDAGTIDKIRSQPKPNEIDKETGSYYTEDIQQMVKLLGSHCKSNSIDEISKVIKDIHETFNDKDVPEIKNWVRLLTGLHPAIDKQIKQYGFWSMPYSEIIGTNTILYYANTNSIDITFWAKKPMFTDNQIVWTQSPWESPHYIRESTRQKLDSGIVAYMQNANHETTKYMRRNLIWESVVTTKKLTGGEIRQKRPIEPVLPDINHGASLNNDWYHNYFRIMDGADGNKSIAWHDAVCHLTQDGYFVHLLVNHITPLINASIAQAEATDLKGLDAEDTFPNRPAKLRSFIDHSGQEVWNNEDFVNNDILKPEIIQGE
jgi:hypothetical protein